jgi:hypothetical protein
MSRDGQGTEQPKLDAHIEETMGEADTHLVRLARAEAKQVVDSEGWLRQQPHANRGRLQPAPPNRVAGHSLPDIGTTSSMPISEIVHPSTTCNPENQGK